MGVLIICIAFNSLLGILFKVFSKYDIDLFPAIVVNYFVAITTASLFLGKWPIPIEVWSKPWLPYAIGLGILFITFFYIMAITVQKAGLVVTTIFQKMSLLAPTIMGLIIFHESKSVWKLVGIFLAIMAIIIVSYSKKTNASKLPREHILLALLVFFGSALIDAILYLVDVQGLVTDDRTEFVSTPFLVSGTVGLLVLIISRAKSRKSIPLSSLWAGIVLGIPNFFSIYFILKSLSVGLEGSVVFPVNNIGILLFSTLVGIFIFKESATRNKIVGLVISILAILLISYG